MATVKNNSSVSITRTQFSNGGVANTESLGNQLFNGYVYNMSLDVGFNGEPTTLTLNLALNRTTKNVKKSLSASEQRRSDLSALNAVIAAKNLASKGNIGYKGNTGTSSLVSQIADSDFNIKEDYLGINSSYNINIIDGSGNVSYSLNNFKITSYSINKKVNEKILTLTLKDNAVVLNKIYIGLIGQEVALDERSEVLAAIDKLQLNCPQTPVSPAGTVTLKDYKQKLHFSGKQLAEKLNVDTKYVEIITDKITTGNQANFIILRSKDPNKTIFNGYGAIVILGEEDYKDSPCQSADANYSFDTLLTALGPRGLGITIYENPLPQGASSDYDRRSLRDKSNGKLKRSYHGNLKEVLNQWCDDFAYSYVVDFSPNKTNVLTIKGIDLAGPVNKETVLTTKLNFETLESQENQSDFVIQSQDFNYDLSQKNLRLYSSLYFKDAKDRDYEFSKDLGLKDLNCIRLDVMFPQLFAAGGNTVDFCGSKRNYDQVVTSAILGKYCPKLRQIYNYSIKAYSALGFIPLDNDALKARLNFIDTIDTNGRLIFMEAASRAVDIEADLLYDSVSNKLNYDFTLGFYNQELASKVEAIEGFIADFIGKHYWTDEVFIKDGSLANQNQLVKYEITTDPSSLKVAADQLYKIPAFTEIRYLISSIKSLFNGTDNYFKAFSNFAQLKYSTEKACNEATVAYQKYINDLASTERIRFYVNRNTAQYGVFQELIDDLQVMQYRIGDVAKLFSVDLAEVYAPVFKAMNPVSMGVFQTAMPINVSNIPLGTYDFGILAGLKDDINIFSFRLYKQQSYTNTLEFQNSIRNRCEIIKDQIQKGDERNKNLTKNSCSKTILYSACVLPADDKLIDNNNSNQLAVAEGPNPQLCQKIEIVRKVPGDAIFQAHINKTVLASNGIITIAPTNINNIYIQTARNPQPTPFRAIGQIYESITMPSQMPYSVRFVSKTSTSLFLPFQSYIKGGLEDVGDITKIIENDGFSVSIDTNNITSNVSELFGDQTKPEYATSVYIDTTQKTGSPIVMNYRGYSETLTSPIYEAKTFAEFHEILRQYYNDKALSQQEPSVSYSNDIFCSAISSQLKNLLSVFSGLTKMTLTVGENGLHIQTEFQSHPAKPEKMQTLINKYRPNIKLINTNFFK